ncbi:MAG: lactonase family protein [Anaerolineae bacterium]|nr:lactonase family protein [Anaerolineae bacterium]
MKGRTIFLITLIFVVTAAIFVIPPMLRALSVVPPTLSSQPDFVATSEQVTAPNSNTSDAITVLAVTEKENSVGFGLQARPVNPATLADLPGYVPIDFGHHYTYAVTPDRKTLAVITWLSDNNAGGELHLIDLNTWTDMPANLNIDDYVGELTFGVDGRTLYWTIPTAYDPAHGMPRDYQLYRYDLDSRQLSVITQLPSSFIPGSQRLSSGNVAIVGIPTDPNNLAEDVPHLLIIDPARNRIVADLRLDGVKAGQFREQETNATPSAQEESWQYVMYNPGLAWDLDRKVLYIVHADDDKVTVVDLVNGTLIKQTQIRPPRSLLDWMSDSLASAAVAKGGPRLGAHVILSRDGERLYVFSEKTEMGIPKTTDLRVIATDGMREINHLDELLTDFALTPDGKSLLVVKGEIDRSYGFDMLVNRDVYILDAETLRERIHIRIDQVDQIVLNGFSSDGRYAYLRGSSAQWVEGSGWRNWRTMWQSLDLTSYRLISAGESGSLYSALLHIAP